MTKKSAVQAFFDTFSSVPRGYDPVLSQPSAPAGEYSVRVAGVSYRQDAIRSCKVGDRVDFEADEANPHDPRAIAVYVEKRQIGFLPKDGWLTDYLLDQGGWAEGWISGIGESGSGDLGVTLAVKKG